MGQKVVEVEQPCQNFSAPLVCTVLWVSSKGEVREVSMLEKGGSPMGLAGQVGRNRHWTV